jgi:hypothetical protein
MIRNPKVARYVSSMQTPITQCSVTWELYGVTNWLLAEDEVRRELKQKFSWIGRTDMQAAIDEHQSRVESSRYVAGVRAVKKS